MKDDSVYLAKATFKKLGSGRSSSSLNGRKALP
jgi:hypothetical protein